MEKIYRNQLKPMIKWMGGKYSLIKRISQFIPYLPHQKFHYIEPFLGGGSMMLFFLENFPRVNPIVNDINKKLINTYLITKLFPTKLIENMDLLIKEYQNLPNEQERKKYYLEQRERFNIQDLSRIEEACLFLFLNKTCFNGMYRENSSGVFNSHYGGYRIKELLLIKKRIFSLSPYLQRVNFLNQDYSEMEKFITSKSFFYLDQPYFGTGFDAYHPDSSGKDIDRLFEFCQKINHKGGKFLLSNSDKNDILKEKFKDFKYQYFYHKRGNGVKSVDSNEVLIWNY